MGKELNFRPQTIMEIGDVSPLNSPPDFIQFTAPLQQLQPRLIGASETVTLVLGA